MIFLEALHQSRSRYNRTVGNCPISKQTTRKSIIDHRYLLLTATCIHLLNYRPSVTIATFLLQCKLIPKNAQYIIFSIEHTI